MITGIIKSDEARIRLKVKGTGDRHQEVVAVIDTGYTASLTLPPDIVAALDLRWRSMDRYTLADGSDTEAETEQAKAARLRTDSSLLGVLGASVVQQI